MWPKNVFIEAETERTIGHGLPRFTTSEGLFTAVAIYLCTYELARLPSKRSFATPTCNPYRGKSLYSNYTCGEMQTTKFVCT